MAACGATRGGKMVPIIRQAYFDHTPASFTRFLMMLMSVTVAEEMHQRADRRLNRSRRAWRLHRHPNQPPGAGHRPVSFHDAPPGYDLVFAAIHAP